MASIDKATTLGLAIVGVAVTFLLAMAIWSGVLGDLSNFTANVTNGIESFDTGNPTINAIMEPLSLLPAAAVPLAVVGSIVGIAGLLRMST